ncbi:MAG: DUF58 domain-containing protein [Cellulomonadaceae bacterium]|jgi:uncharacterized protein (DUF58 family)|nr:DUF58 domain-containing protein [Cellulomonadaceae bacterium]
MALTWRALALAGIGIIPVLLWPAPGTVLAWAAVILVVVLVDLALAAAPVNCELQRTVPPSVRFGQETQSVLTVRNLSTRTARFTIRDAWPPSVVPEATEASERTVASAAAVTAHSARHSATVRPGDGARFTTVLLPRRRGDRHAGPVTVRSWGPLRIAARQRSYPVAARLRVLPEFSSRKHLPSRLAQLRELDGRASVQIRGHGTEFDSLREYVMGDDVRSIDWRATARRGDVVVRTWRPERDRRVLILLDTSRTSAARTGDAPRLDTGIESALLLAALADRAGDRVQVLAFDRQVRARMLGATGPRLLPAVAEALSTLEPRLTEMDWPGAVDQVLRQVSQRALVVLLTSLDPAPVTSGLMPVIAHLTSRHHVVVASVDDPEVDGLRVGGVGGAQHDAASGYEAASPYDHAAAERLHLQRAACAADLQRLGATVITALPDALPPALADTYIALKAAGKL